LSGSCRHEEIWTFYVVTVCAAAGIGGGSPAFVALHLGVLALAWLPRWVSTDRRRLAVLRGLFSTVALPIVFSSMAMVLPAVHPEPFEFRWIAFDRALFGVDPTVALQALFWPPLVEALQICYATFYLIPIVAVLWAARRDGIAAYEWALDLVVLGFTLSYVGYLLWPTLPPYRFLWHEAPIEGLLFAAPIHAALDAAEIHRWNCFPSGHTMLTALSMVVLWRHARHGFWTLLLPAGLLVAATLVLRYHYAVDVLAGLCGVPLTLWLARRARAG
jgi:hypothetical protein